MEEPPKIGDDGAIAFAEALKVNTTLQLSKARSPLSSMPHLTCGHACSLTGSLKVNIEEGFLVPTGQISDTGAVALADALKHHSKTSLMYGAVTMASKPH